jgi:hypothetical protein
MASPRMVYFFSMFGLGLVSFFGDPSSRRLYVYLYYFLEGNTMFLLTKKNFPWDSTVGKTWKDSLGSGRGHRFEPCVPGVAV